VAARERAQTWAIAAAATAAAINAETDRLTEGRGESEAGTDTTESSSTAIQTKGNNVAAVSTMTARDREVKEEADGSILTSSAPLTSMNDAEEEADGSVLLSSAPLASMNDAEEEADGSVLTSFAPLASMNDAEGDREVAGRKSAAQAVPLQYLVPLIVGFLVYLAPMLHSSRTSDMMPMGARIMEQPPAPRSRRRHHHVAVSDEAPLPQRSARSGSAHREEDQKKSKNGGRWPGVL